MKVSQRQLVNFSLGAKGVRCLLLMVALGAVMACTAFLAAQNLPAENPTKKPSLPDGYLNKATPPALRFASPPKPPVAYLAPLAITHDPQPVFSTQFAEPIAEITIQVRTNVPTPPPVTSLQWPEIATLFTNAQTKIPSDSLAEAPISPQFLVRFFKVPAPPPEPELLLPGPVRFQLPVPPGGNTQAIRESAAD